MTGGAEEDQEREEGHSNNVARDGATDATSARSAWQCAECGTRPPEVNS